MTQPDDCGATGWQAGCGVCFRCVGAKPLDAQRERTHSLILADLETIRKALWSGQISAAKVDAQRAFLRLEQSIRASIRAEGT